MLDNRRSELLKTTFWRTFLVSIVTFFCPFIEGLIRGDVYWKIFKSFVIDGRTLDLKLAFILVLLIGTLLWLPIMGYAFYRYTVKERYYTIKQRMVNYFLFGIGVTVYILPIYVIIDGENLFEIFDWGYALTLVCTTIMFICYLKIQQQQLIDEDDFSGHLIDDDG